MHLCSPFLLFSTKQHDSIRARENHVPTLDRKFFASAQFDEVKNPAEGRDLPGALQHR